MAISGYPNINGTNFQGKTVGYAGGSTASTTYVTLLNVSGRGILTSISQMLSHNSSATGWIQITVDGVVVVNNTEWSLLYYTNTNLSPMWKFNSSLLIEHKTGGGTVFSRASYLLD